MDAAQAACPDAAVVWANSFQFGPEEENAHQRVESRMLLWCRAGKGTVLANEQAFAFAPGTFLLLPWCHRIHYTAGARNPFLVGGVHVVPRHGRSVPVQLGVAHDRGAELAGAAERGNVELSGLDSVVAGDLRHHRALEQLGEYTVALAQEERLRDEATARRLGVLLMEEFQHVLRRQPVGQRPYPPELQRLLVFIEDHLHRPLHLDDLIDLVELSPATVNRLFRGHLSTTPRGYITARRMERARDLLRTTRLSVADVGRRVGYEDAFHFSRSFSRTVGQSPLAFRQQARLL